MVNGSHFGRFKSYAASFVASSLVDSRISLYMTYKSSHSQLRQTMNIEDIMTMIATRAGFFPKSDCKVLYLVQESNELTLSNEP